MSTANSNSVDAPALSQEQVQLARQIEEASLNAWPAMQQTFMDGWVLRFSKGFTKRSNSIIPLYPPAQPPSTQTLLEKVRHCENLYAREQLQTIFRLTSITAPRAAPMPNQADTGNAHLDQLLEERGYAHIETSLVLHKPLTEIDPGVAQWQLLPLDQWLQVYCQLTGMAEPARSLHQVILNSIAGECGFMVLRVDNNPVACGLGVIERDLVGLFDIYTQEDNRGQGYGRALVNQLLHWARTMGAAHAYLQVLETNRTATSLYTTLGFSEIYRYWYRSGS